jgi:hypothetical protein
MDWNLAIERNREALKRILAALVAMAELGGQFTSFPRKSALPHGSALAEKSKLSPASTLPRHLHRAVLRLLRPAEAATRRLVIVAARSIVVPPPPPRGAWSTSHASQGRINAAAGTTRILPLLSLSKERGRGTAELSTEARRAKVEGGGGGVAQNTPSAPSPCRFSIGSRVGRPVPATQSPTACRASRCPALPRVSHRAPPPACTLRSGRRHASRPAARGARLRLRLAALASALDDLPRQAKRFARWRARRDTITAQTATPQPRQPEHRATAASRATYGRCAPAGRPASTPGAAGKNPDTRCMTS